MDISSLLGGPDANARPRSSKPQQSIHQHREQRSPGYQQPPVYRSNSPPNEVPNPHGLPPNPPRYPGGPSQSPLHDDRAAAHSPLSHASTRPDHQQPIPGFTNVNAPYQSVYSPSHGPNLTQHHARPDPSHSPSTPGSHQQPSPAYPPRSQSSYETRDQYHPTPSHIAAQASYNQYAASPQDHYQQSEPRTPVASSYRSHHEGERDVRSPPHASHAYDYPNRNNSSTHPYGQQHDVRATERQSPGISPKTRERNLSSARKIESAREDLYGSVHEGDNSMPAWPALHRSTSMKIDGVLNENSSNAAASVRHEGAVAQHHSKMSEPAAVPPSNSHNGEIISQDHRDASDLQAERTDRKVEKDIANPSEPARKRARLASSSEPDARNVKSRHQTSNGTKITPQKPPRLPIPIFAQSVRAQPKRSHNASVAHQTPATGNGTLGGPSNGALSQPRASIVGPLGRWEPSIVNITPIDEVVKRVSDFIYVQMTQHPQLGVASAGATSLSGSMIEIEAKLGRVIDQHTNDRLRIPVVTETVLSSVDPNLRTSFEPSLTLQQHKALNAFLNDATKATQTPKPTPQNPNPAPNPRSQIKYKHTKETDSFYGLTDSGLQKLPHVALGSRKKPPSVRITRDQKTNTELARVVKTRLADLDVYSPQTQVDWRVSINVETHFPGDVADLKELSGGRGTALDRSKDRVSYKHQAYQVDLTMVHTIDADPKNLKPPDHELEVEVGSDEVRRQITLLSKGEPHQYPDLIKGLVDNMRLLAKNTPESFAPPI